MSDIENIIEEEIGVDYYVEKLKSSIEMCDIVLNKKNDFTLKQVKNAIKVKVKVEEMLADCRKIN